MGLFSSIGKALGGVTKAVGSIFDPISSIAGPLISGGLSYMGQNSANAASLASTREQMDFQERMRATQYQTSVDDLKKAGLNPMLAYSQGGAGTPSGSSYVAQNALGQGVSSSMDAKRTYAQYENLKEQNALLESQKQTQQTQQQLNFALAEKAKKDAWLSASSAYNLDAMTPENVKLSRAQQTAALASALQSNASSRNFDVNSAYTGLKNYHESLLTPRNERARDRDKTFMGEQFLDWNNMVKHLRGRANNR